MQSKLNNDIFRPWVAFSAMALVEACTVAPLHSSSVLHSRTHTYKEPLRIMNVFLSHTWVLLFSLGELFACIYASSSLHQHTVGGGLIEQTPATFNAPQKVSQSFTHNTTMIRLDKVRQPSVGFLKGQSSLVLCRDEELSGMHSCSVSLKAPAMSWFSDDPILSFHQATTLIWISWLKQQRHSNRLSACRYVLHATRLTCHMNQTLLFLTVFRNVFTLYV